MASTLNQKSIEKCDVNFINHSDDLMSDTTSTIPSRLHEASSIDPERSLVTGHEQQELTSVLRPAVDIAGTEIGQPQFSRRFPHEIHIIIISQVDDIPTLAALSLVSRAFHELAEPYLYVELKTPHRDSLPLVLRTILSKPELGRHVQSWTGTGNSDDEDLATSVFDTEELSRLFSAASWVYDPTEARLNDGFIWEKVLEYGIWKTFAPILLCLLPNLQELNLTNSSYCESYLLMERVLRRAAKLQKNPSLISSNAMALPTFSIRYTEEEDESFVVKSKESTISDESILPLEFALSSLRRISIFSDSIEFPTYGIEPVHTLPYLDLPSVSSFLVHNIIDTFDKDNRRTTYDSSYKFPLPQFEFKTTNLVMNHSGMEGCQLCDYLSYFNVLETFEYMIEYSPSDAPYFPVLPYVVEALEHLCGSLVQLSIVQPQDQLYLDEEDEESPIDSLVDFAVLKKLTASANILLGRPGQETRDDQPLASFVYDEAYINDFPDLLPPSLEELTMTLCEMSAAEAIKKLLDNPLPSLRSIEIEFKYDHDMSTLRGGDIWPKLESLAAESGIKLSMSLTDKEKRGWAVAAPPMSTET